MIFKNEQPRGELDGFLDSGCRLVGELHFGDTFRVDGRVEGTLVSDGNVYVGEGGEIDGDVRVRHVFIAGTVRGTIHAAARVEVGASGRIEGDVHTRTLVVEDGATIQGHCNMDESARKERLPKLVPEKAAGPEV